MSDRIDTKAVLAECLLPNPANYKSNFLCMTKALLQLETVRAALAQEITDREALEKRRVEDFVAGAKWWEYDRENATMWQSDQERAAAAADIHFGAQALREAALAAEEKKP